MQVFDSTPDTPQLRPSRDDDGVHVAAFLGDANGNAQFEYALSGENSIVARFNFVSRDITSYPVNAYGIGGSYPRVGRGRDGLRRVSGHARRRGRIMQNLRDTGHGERPDHDLQQLPALRPHPSKLFVEVTTRCNLRCSACVKESAGHGIREGQMTAETFARLAGGPRAVDERPREIAILPDVELEPERPRRSGRHLLDRAARVRARHAAQGLRSGAAGFACRYSSICFSASS